MAKRSLAPDRRSQAGPAVVVCLMILSCCAGPARGQPAPAGPSWNAWNFLLGEWAGEGTGVPGEGSGGFTFSLELQKRVLERRSYASYPAAKDRPAFSHEDLTIVFQEDQKPVRAVYFDNEGHVINYTVEATPDSGSVTFLSDLLPSSPRYRLQYQSIGEGRVRLTFDIAPPNAPDNFIRYIEGSARRIH